MSPSPGPQFWLAPTWLLCYGGPAVMQENQVSVWVASLCQGISIQRMVIWTWSPPQWLANVLGLNTKLKNKHPPITTHEINPKLYVSMWQNWYSECLTYLAKVNGSGHFFQMNCPLSISGFRDGPTFDFIFGNPSQPKWGICSLFQRVAIQEV